MLVLKEGDDPAFIEANDREISENLMRGFAMGRDDSTPFTLDVFKDCWEEAIPCREGTWGLKELRIYDKTFPHDRWEKERRGREFVRGG